MARHTTYCRICSALCGLLVDVEDGAVVRVAGDPDHPLTRGFTCAKGRGIGWLHARSDRFLTARRYGRPVTYEEAVADIAASLESIIAEHGPDAVGMFVGTQSYTASLTHPFMNAWFRSIGSRRLFSTMTIDQSAKWVAAGRMGSWAAGRQRFDESDVWLFVGTNPLVSMQGGNLTGFPIHDGSRALRAARRRGMRLVVVDPSRTELAAQADVHLQLRPGTDAVLLAGLLRVILEAGLGDAVFCARWADGVDDLRAAVQAATPELVTRVCGVTAADVEAAARVFAGGRRGMATSGTGPDMGPWSNLAEHLVQVLNVVCGRFPRVGDRHTAPAVLTDLPAPCEGVVGPRRSWETGPRSRSGWGTMMGQLPSPILPEEILDPADDRLRALVVVGGNPVDAFPDRQRITAALGALQLLVTIDPYPSATAALATHVIAPALALERPDHTRGYEHLMEAPFAQHTDAVLPRPDGVVEDWRFFLDLAAAMGRTLTIGQRVYEPGGPRPTSEELLVDLARRGRVDYDAVRAAPSGLLADHLAPAVVRAAPGEPAERFAVMPPDVAAELAAALSDERLLPRADRPFLLTVRRAKEAMNSVAVPGIRDGCRMHPDDLAALGLVDGAAVVLVSDHGHLEASVRADGTMRPGTVSALHCLDPNPNVLLSITQDRQTISAMPWMTGVPVSVNRRP